MRVKELIEELGLVLKENGNIEVTLYTDRGKKESNCQGGVVEYLDEDYEAISDEAEISSATNKVYSLYGE